MRHSKLFRIAGAVFGLTLAACGSELEGQAPDAVDTTQDTGGEVTPDTDVVDPDTEVTPDTDTVDPDTDTVVPDTDTEDPDTDAIDTDTDAVDPDVDADTDTADPDTDTEVVEPPSGESCDDPYLITVPVPFTAPVQVTGDTTGKSNDHSVAANACLGMPFDEGQDAPDEAWSFTAPTAGVYRVSLLSGSGDVGFYILASCGASAECLGGSDYEGVGAESLDERLVRLAAGQTVFIVVDGYEAESFGSYTLTVSPGAAFVPGDICDDAIALTLDTGTGAYTGTGDTTTANLTDAFEVGQCGPDFFYTGTGSPDQVFSFTAPTAGTWTATLTPAAGADLMLYGYVGACGQTCAGAADDGLAGDAEEIVLADLQAGQQVFLVVDSWVPEEGGAFTLSVASACTPSCDLETCGGEDGCGGVCGCGPGQGCIAGSCEVAGETCADPIPLTAGPDNTWTGAGNLVGRLNDVSAYTTTLGCALNGFSSNGNRPDETFSFTAATTGPYDFTVTSVGATTDVLFAVFTGPGCAAGSCLGFVDNNPEGTFADTRTFNLTEGTTYTIVVDSYSDSALGPYTVQVAPQCVPFCAEGSCNVSDGCSGTCGCGANEQCNASNTCEPIPSLLGDNCINPYIATGGGFTATVDTCTFADDFRPAASGSACSGSSSTTANNRDVIIKFNSPTSGRFTVTSSGTSWDGTLNIVDGTAGCPSTGTLTACLANYDDPEPMTLTFDAVGGRDYYIIVDSWFGECGTTNLAITQVCLPQCTPGVCGVNDGCEGTCGCTAGQTCDQPNAPSAGACVDTAGETCAAALPMVEAPTGTWTGAGDLTNSADVHARGSCPALGTGTPTGTGSPDQYWSFTPTQTGLHKIDLTRGTVGDIWFAIYQGTGCTNSGEGANCRGYYQRETGTAPETLTLSLTAGTKYTIVVETVGSTTTRGTYTLAVTKVCDPVCTAGTCGNEDGCGGTCGCAPGSECSSGTCVGITGESCAAPFALTRTGNTWSGSGSLFGATADVATTVECAPLGQFNLPGVGIDEVWSFTTGDAGNYRVTVTPTAGDIYFGLFTAVNGSCGTCLGNRDQGTSGAETFTFENLPANTAHNVVVEAFGATAHATGTSYTVAVEYLCVRTPGICDGQQCNTLDNCGLPCGCTAGQQCNTDGTCGEATGNSCAAPFVATGITNTTPYTLTVNTCGFTNSVNTTSSANLCATNNTPSTGRDFIVAFTPPEAGTYTVTSTQPLDLIMNVLSTCPTGDYTTCAVAGTDNGTTSTMSITLSNVTPEQTYYIVVDQWGSPACAAAANTTFTITKQCVPQCTGLTCDQDNGCGQPCGCPTGGVCTNSVCVEPPGNSCTSAGAFTLAAGVYTATGDIRGTGITDNFRSTGCTSFAGTGGYLPSATVASRDQVFAFTAPTTGAYTITLDPTTSTDIYFQVMSGESCSTSTCMGVMDEGNAGVNEVTTVNLVGGSTYWIVVDSWTTTNTAPHPFTLTIQGQCTPGPNECDGRACDFMTTCGTPCGCDAGLVCENSECITAPAAAYDVCETAGVVVEGTPATFDTCELNSDYDFGALSCAVPTTGAPDGVVTFVAPSTGTFSFQASSDPLHDVVLNYVVGAANECPDAEVECTGGMDDRYEGTPEVFELELTAGQVVYLFVSGYYDAGWSDDCGEVTVSVQKVQAEICNDDIDNDLNGDTDCDDEECADDPACFVEQGASCANPFQLAANATNDVWTGSGSLVGATDDQNRGTCPQLANNSYTPTGIGTADEVWSFTTNEAGPYRIDLARGAAGDIFYYVYSNSTCANDVCLGYVERETAATETQTFTLAAATTYYIVVESYGTTSTLGEYTLTATKLCAPQCDGETCGQDDGCSGTCGCPSGESCQAGTCAAVPGESCASPLVVGGVPIGTPFTFTANTCDYADDYAVTSSTGGCRTNNSTGVPNRDFVVAFTPTESGRYVAASTELGGLDLIVNVVSGACPAARTYGTCIAGGDTPASATFDAVAGTTYYVVVDQYGNACSSSTTQNTTFTITQQCVSTGCGTSCNTTDNCGNACACPSGVSCSTSGEQGAGICNYIAGDTCANPLVATGISDTTPYTVTVDTCSFTNGNQTSSTATGCSTNSSTSTGRDFIVQFTPPEAGTYVVTSTQPVDLIMNVVAGTCPGSPYGTCTAGIDAGTSGVMSVTLANVTPAQTYYIVVDQWGSPTCSGAQNTTFAITKQCVSTGCNNACNTTDNCGTPCNCGGDQACTTSGAQGPGICEALVLPEGDACSDPFEVGAVAVGSPFTLTLDTCTFTDSVRPTTTGGCAGVSATAPGGKDYYVAFTPTESGVYTIASSEPSGSPDLVLNVIANACPTSAPTTCVAGRDTPASVDITATAGTTYYVLVDGFNAAACGNTTFSITRKPPPLEFIDGCPAGLCTMTAGGGPNGGDLYQYTIPANQHPTVNDFGQPAGCSDWGTGPDLLVALNAAAYDQVTVSTCTATAADSSVAVWGSDPRQASPTSIGCNTDALGTSSTTGVWCSKVGNPTTGGFAALPVPVSKAAANQVFVVVDAYGTTSSGYWNGTAARTFNVELIRTRPLTETNCTNNVDDDGDGSTDCDDTDCSADAACQTSGPVDGDSCLNPIALAEDAGALTAFGNLTGTGDEFSDYETCPVLGGGFEPDELVGTPDQVFEFTVPANGRYTITVLPDTGDDLVWALYSGASCVDATCVGFLDTGLTGEEETFTLSLTAGTNYYLVVDTYSDAPFADFAVFVESCVPDVACNGTTCGTDSCGTPCTCAAGTTCNTSTSMCQAPATPVVIVGWDFGTSGSHTLVATTSNAANATKAFIIGGATITAAGYGGVTGQAAGGTNWHDATTTPKYWQTSVTTTGFQNITLDSRQLGSNSGPRDWRIYYSLNGTDWTAVTDGIVAVTSTSVWAGPTSLALPAAVSNQATVHLRWLVTTTVSVNNGTVANGGTSRLDDVVIKGVPLP